MNRRELVERAVVGENLEAVPVAPLIGGHSAVLYGASVEEAYRNSELMARLQIKAAKFYDVDMVFHYMDTTVEAEALGAKVSIKNGLPAIVEHLHELPEPIFSEKGRIKVFVDALAKISRELSSTKIIGAYVLGPFTLLCQLLGLTRVFREVMRGEATFTEEYLVKLSEYSRGYVDLLASEGRADLVMVLEPCLSLVRPEVFEKYSRKALENLLHYIKKKGLYSALHVCGRSNKIIPHLKSLPFDIIQLDYYVNIKEAKNILVNKCVLGNLNTKLFIDSTPDEVFNEAKKCIEDGERKLHILSAGCEIPLRSRPENIKALVKAAREKYA